MSSCSDGDECERAQGGPPPPQYLQSDSSLVEFDAEDTAPPLLGVFLAEFDLHIGRIMTAKFPADCISKATFESLSAFVIPKMEVMHRIVKINRRTFKVLGYPVKLKKDQYARNEFLFNLCFIVENLSHSDVVYEPLVRKLARYLCDLELQVAFLSDKDDGWHDRVHKLLADVFHELNEHGECSLLVTGQTSIHLRVPTAARHALSRAPHAALATGAAATQHHGPPVPPHVCPVLRRWPPPVDNTDAKGDNALAIDVLAKKVLCHVDGYRTVAEIAACAAVDVELVQRCVQDLVSAKMLRLLSRFAYRDVYACDTGICKLYRDPALMARCVSYVQLRPAECGDRGKLSAQQQQHAANATAHVQHVPRANAAAVLRLYCSLKGDIAVSDWCLRHDPRSCGVDEQRLVRFGIAHNLCRRLQAIPVHVPHAAASLGSSQTAGQVQSQRLAHVLADQCHLGQSAEAVALRHQTDVSGLLKELAESDNFVLLYD